MHRAVSICSNASFILYFVDLIPFHCLFMFPLSVAGHESGRYFWTDYVVRPVHVANLHHNIDGNASLHMNRPEIV